MTPRVFFIAAAFLLISACRKDVQDDPVEPALAPRLVLKFQFDSTQVRLNGLGQVSGIPADHAAQSPRFNSMSAHYVEFAPDQFTALGTGEVVYHAPEVMVGGTPAIDFDQSVIVGEGETFLSIPLDQLAPGSYEWLRVSLAYQNYDIDFRVNSPVQYDLSATVASFIGYRTYINTFTIRTEELHVHAAKLQGYWGSEVIQPPIPIPVTIGQAPAGATTVPNPLFSTSPIPAGSCVVTGQFAAPVVITGTETSDLVIIVSLSTNHSFEWTDDGDGIFEPQDGDAVVDMGIRGMIPIVQ